MAYRPVAPAQGAMGPMLMYGQPYMQSSAAAPPADPYFNSVILLLHGGGANGSTVITDSGPAPKTVTCNGNASISTAQSWFGGSALRFDGSGDFLSTPISSAFQFTYAAGLTIEAGVFIAANSSVDGAGNRGAAIVGSGNNGVNGSFILYISGNASTTGTGLTLEWKNAAGTQQDRSVVVSISQGAWHHIAVCVSATATVFFVDGVPYSTAAYTIDVNGPASGSVWVGRGSNVGTWERYLNGYLDELRITRGVRYTAAFTPPTAAFPDVASETTSDPYFANVVSLLRFHGANNSTAFTDVTGKVWTPFGDARIITGPFDGDPGCGSFDGNGDYISTPAHADFNFLTGDFTVECWVRSRTGPQADRTLISNYLFSAPYTSGWSLQTNSAGRVAWNSTGDGFDLIGTTILSAYSWYHIAVSRVGTTNRLFVNGAPEATGTDAQNITSTAILAVARLGNYSATATHWNGDFAVVRITKGVGRYTAAFTPPQVFPAA